MLAGWLAAALQITALAAINRIEALRITVPVGVAVNRNPPGNRT